MNAIANFDPATFMTTEVTGENSTEVIPIPPGEYQAHIAKVEPRTWKQKDGDKSGVVVDMFWEIPDPALAATIGRATVSVKQSLMLDMTDGGAIDMGKGKNVQLGRARAAFGLNDPSRPFSFNQFVGQSAKITVANRIDGDRIYDDVKGITAL